MTDGLIAGDTWILGCQAFDTANGSWVNSSAVLVNSTAPTQGTPILNSTYGTNYTSEDLFCWNQSTYDADGQTVTNIYAWYKDNVLQGLTTQNISYTYTAVGETWICQITPFDGGLYGNVENSTPLTILEKDQNVTATLCPYMSKILIVPDLFYFDWDTGTLTQYNISPVNQSLCGWTYNLTVPAGPPGFIQAMINVTYPAYYVLRYNGTVMDETWNSIVAYDAGGGSFYINVTGDYIVATQEADDWSDNFREI